MLDKKIFSLSELKNLFPNHEILNAVLEKGYEIKVARLKALDNNLFVQAPIDKAMLTSLEEHALEKEIKESVNVLVKLLK